jgi:Skp family chaperone for outer membrane proteins
MRVRVKVLALLATTAVAGGCGQRGDNRQAAAPAGAVAVIDLDEIARRLGSDKQIASAINQRHSALNQQLVNLAKQYSAQIEAEKAKLAGADAQQSEVTVASWQKQANAKLNQVKQQAAADLENTRLALMNDFRDHIKPAARRVAQARGLSVIVTKNDSVIFDYVSAADITDGVVDELMAHAQPAVVTPTSAATPAQATAPTPQAAAAPAQTATNGDPPAVN